MFNIYTLALYSKQEEQCLIYIYTSSLQQAGGAVFNIYTLALYSKQEEQCLIYIH